MAIGKIILGVIAAGVVINAIGSYQNYSEEAKLTPEQRTQRDADRQAKLQAAEEAKAKEAVQAKIDEDDRTGVKCKDKKGTARVGETTNRTLKCGWGKPDRINRTTYASHTKEQWVYGGGNYLYFTDGVLTAIQN